MILGDPPKTYTLPPLEDPDVGETLSIHYVNIIGGPNSIISYSAGAITFSPNAPEHVGTFTIVVVAYDTALYSHHHFTLTVKFPPPYLLV
jgi:hypothetical protein